MNLAIPRRVKRRISCERGASCVEYATLLSLIAIVLISGISATGRGVENKFSGISTALNSGRPPLGRFGEENPTAPGDGNLDGKEFADGGGSTEFGSAPPPRSGISACVGTECE